MNVAAIVSMLHEPPPPRDSASRLFRFEPVLAWTLARLARSHSATSAAILCWDDQLEVVKPLADEAGACVLVKSPRASLPQLDSIAAAQRWSDGWRGGLLGTCHFDRGFYAPFIAESLELLRESGWPDTDDSRVLLVDPAAALVDPDLTRALVAHAESHPALDLVFTQAAPGLCGVLLRETFVHRLARGKSHPGRLLSYWPDTPGRDPITTDACMAVPPALARTLLRFTLDSDRQVRRLTAATADLNGQLNSTDTQRLLAVLNQHPQEDALPRDIVLELTTKRATRPIYSPLAHLAIDRADMPLELAQGIITQAAEADDLRLTLGGVGDPLLYPHLREVVAFARSAGIRAIHIETDLLGVTPEMLDWLAGSGVDVVSAHLPAASAQMYQRIMGVDRLAEALRNLAMLAQRRAGGTPILVPTFTKCALNIEEMEPWYDHFLRHLGSAVIVGPSDYAAQIPDCSCADMSPPRRRACQRLGSRMTILSSGDVVACEEDVPAKHPLGRAGQAPLAQIWQGAFSALRAEHAAANFDGHPLCASCRQWFRP